jgi:hypothetical protein
MEFLRGFSWICAVLRGFLMPKHSLFDRGMFEFCNYLFAFYNLPIILKSNFDHQHFTYGKARNP